MGSRVGKACRDSLVRSQLSGAEYFRPSTPAFDQFNSSAAIAETPTGLLSKRYVCIGC